MTNHTLQKQLFQTGSFLAGTALALGAFGAHALREQITDQYLNVYETGVRYQFFHAFALLILAVFLRRLHEKTVKLAFFLFTSGAIIFSGSLYLLSTSMLWYGEDLKWLGGITPIGGVALITGWLLMAVNGYKYTSSEESHSSRSSRKHKTSETS